ncbi:MAG TPA: cation diffusion facilitator family transporter [Gammaproteobacteria bacterium]|nr:cation diffusion facilitator family transporter [Gammaproteobacteria bacterium]
MHGHKHSNDLHEVPHQHRHAHGGHGHGAGHSLGRNTLWYALLITLGFAGVEGLSGWWAHSLALLGDAGHMVTDASALGLAGLAAWVARRPPSARHSYGLGRAEVVVALVNGVFMLVVVSGILISAIERLRTPQPVMAETVMLVAGLGLLVNLAVAWLLSRGEQTLNMRGALLHVMADALGSVAALLSGIVIYLSGWTPVDPLLSLFICVLILYSSVSLLREVLHVIMEGVPHYLDLPEIGRALAAVKGVSSVHDLHIWTLSSGMVALSAHIMVKDLSYWEEVLDRLRTLLHDRYGIEHVTLQPEPTTHVLRKLNYPQA